jgi:hypothetical protein
MDLNLNRFDTTRLLEIVPFIVTAIRIAERATNKEGSQKEDLAVAVVMDDLMPLLAGTGVAPAVLKAPTVQRAMRSEMVATIALVNAIRDEQRRLATLTPAA